MNKKSLEKFLGIKIVEKNEEKKINFSPIEKLMLENFLGIEIKSTEKKEKKIKEEKVYELEKEKERVKYPDLTWYRIEKEKNEVKTRDYLLRIKEASIECRKMGIIIESINGQKIEHCKKARKTYKQKNTKYGKDNTPKIIKLF